MIHISSGVISDECWLEGDQKYCAIITLDIKNSFNSTDWDATLAALDGKDMPNYLMELIKDYFKDKVLLYNTDDGRKSYAVSARVP